MKIPVIRVADLDAVNGGIRLEGLVQGPFGNCSVIATSNAVRWNDPDYFASLTRQSGFDTRVSLATGDRIVPYGQSTLNAPDFVRGGSFDDHAVVQAIGQAHAGSGAPSDLRAGYANGSYPADTFEHLGYASARTDIQTGIRVAQELNEPLVGVVREGGVPHAVTYVGTQTDASGRETHTFNDPHGRDFQVAHEDLWQRFTGDATLGSRLPSAEAPRVPELEARPLELGGRSPLGTAGGVAGAALVGTGLVENLAKDGILPESFGNAVAPVNNAVGTVLAPFAIGGGEIANTVTNATGSHTAGFIVDTAVNAGVYYGAGPFAPLVAATTGLDYLANRSDFAAAGRSSLEYVKDLGINTSPGTFGHDLATEFRGGTSGLTTNLPETQSALSTFGQLYTSQKESGAQLDLTTRNGYGAADAGAQERLLDLKDISLQAARDPNVAGGAVFFPDGTSGNWVDPAYANATRDLVQNHGYGEDYLGNMSRDEVINLQRTESQPGPQPAGQQLGSSGEQYGPELPANFASTQTGDTQPTTTESTYAQTDPQPTSTESSSTEPTYTESTYAQAEPSYDPGPSDTETV